MKHLSFICLLLFAGCDAPRDRALSRGTSSTNASPAPSVYYLSQNPTLSNTDTEKEINSGTPTPTSPTGPTIPSNLSHCTFSKDNTTSYQYTSTLLGSFNLCIDQSQSDKIYVQFQKANNKSLCFTPTHINSNSQVFVLGDPVCVTPKGYENIYDLVLAKNIDIASIQNLKLNSTLAMYDDFYKYGHPYNEYILNPDALLKCFTMMIKYNSTAHCETFKAAQQYLKITF
jgi:hypothetical protein